MTLGLLLLRFACLTLQYKLGQVRRVATGAKGVPYLVTHDGRTIRYPDPLISLHDTVVIEIKSGKIIDFIKFDTGNLAMVVGGRNMGRVGIVTHRERHAGRKLIVWATETRRAILFFCPIFCKQGWIMCMLC